MSFEMSWMDTRPLSRCSLFCSGVPFYNSFWSFSKIGSCCFVLFWLFLHHPNVQKCFINVIQMYFEKAPACC